MSFISTYQSRKSLFAEKLNNLGINNAKNTDGLTTLISYLDDVQNFIDGLLLYGDKSVAQSGDIVTLFALVIEDGKAVAEKTVTFCDELQSFSPTTRDFEVSSEKWRLTLANSGNIIVIGDNPNYLFIGKQNGGYVISDNLEDAAYGQVNLNGDSICFDGNQTLYSENDTYDISTIITIATWNSNYFSVGGSSQTSLSDITIDIILGSATTNINGIATYTYTCTGAGDVTITAKCIFEGETIRSTYDITDNPITKYLSLTSDKNILSYADNENATLTATYTEEGVPVSGETVTMKVYDSTNTILLETLTVVDEGDGTYTASYSSKGAGNINIKAECMNLQETYSILDCIYYDSCTSDTTSNYNTPHSSNSISFSDGSLLFTVGTNYTFVHLGGNTGVTNVSDYTGKTVRFEADLNPSYKSRLRIYQTVNGTNTHLVSSNFITEQGTVSIQGTINSNATAISFRVDASENNQGETVKINNWKIYPI